MHFDSSTDSNMDLDQELELVRASLLPEEEIVLISDENTLKTLEVRTSSSSYKVHVEQRDHDGHYKYQIKSDGMNREEALGWEKWVKEIVEDNRKEAEQSGYPLYTLMTDHFLPLLQSTSTKPEPLVKKPTEEDSLNKKRQYKPGHILFSSHHLLAPSKRRDLASLSSQLDLVGFGKVGYPGIIFAEGDVDNLEEFAREVKSWQWLALRLRVLEADPKANAKEWETRKGDWGELTKVGEAVEWLKTKQKDHLLLDVGIGSGGHKA
jgi:hypothetical protein